MLAKAMSLLVTDKSFAVQNAGRYLYLQTALHLVETVHAYQGCRYHVVTHAQNPDMPYFMPPNDAIPSDPHQREADLNVRIQAIEDDLANLSLFPLRDKSVNYKVLQGMRKYWVGVREGCMASQIDELFLPDDRQAVIHRVALMERELGEIKQRIAKESMPKELVLGRPPKTFDTSVLISAWSEKALREFVQDARHLHDIGHDEIEGSELDH